MLSNSVLVRIKVPAVGITCRPLSKKEPLKYDDDDDDKESKAIPVRGREGS
jgi:hypothetical protein